MANIKINGTTYEDVPSIEVPNESGEMVEYKERMTPYEACIADFKARGWTEYTPSEGETVNYTFMRKLFFEKKFVSQLKGTPNLLEQSQNLIIDELDDDVTYISDYAFMRNRNTFLSILPTSLKSIGSYAFNINSGVSIEYFPTSLKSIGSYAFNEAFFMNTKRIPSGVTSLKGHTFYGCTMIGIIYLEAIATINSYDFGSCINLRGLVLMTTEGVCQLVNSNGIQGTPIASGTGYIYVPSALVDSYKTATNWSVYASQFRALEDYTVDGTITGELDESKI